MTKHLPPIPPASVSPKGPGGDHTQHLHTGEKKPAAERNYDEQGQQGNSKQNTTNQGYQQDR